MYNNIMDILLLLEKTLYLKVIKIQLRSHKLERKQKV
jgi:hypothetical protein